MAERRTEEAPVAAPPTGPAGPASGDLRAQVNRAYASAAPTAADEPESRRTSGGEPPGPLPETAARFAAAMAAVEQQQARRPTPQPSSGSARPASPAPKHQPAPAPTGSAVRRPRRARLRLTHVDPWSVLKTSLLLSIALGIVMVVAVAVIWSVLNASGLWDSINRTVGEVVGTEASAEFRIEEYVGTERVLGFTMLVAALDVVLVTVVATLGAFLYNLAAALLGGLEVVLAEDEF